MFRVGIPDGGEWRGKWWESWTEFVASLFFLVQVGTGHLEGDGLEGQP